MKDSVELWRGFIMDKSMAERLTFEEYLKLHDAGISDRRIALLNDMPVQVLQYRIRNVWQFTEAQQNKRKVEVYSRLRQKGLEDREIARLMGTTHANLNKFKEQQDLLVPEGSREVYKWYDGKTPSNI
jgi:hypothetical protein